MTLGITAKVLIHVWLYDFYDVTLSPGKQRRHMIKNVMTTRVLTVLREYVTSLTTSVTTMQLKICPL